MAKFGKSSREVMTPPSPNGFLKNGLSPLHLHHLEKWAYFDGSAVNITDLFKKQKCTYMLMVEPSTYVHFSFIELYGRNPQSDKALSMYIFLYLRIISARQMDILPPLAAFPSLLPCPWTPWPPSACGWIQWRATPLLQHTVRSLRKRFLTIQDLELHIRTHFPLLSGIFK